MTYLSAKELKIQSFERKGLIDFTEDKTLRHNPKVTFDTCPRDSTAPIFNMNYAERRADCGTVMCIGGYVAHRANRIAILPVTADFYVEVQRSEVLNELYYPSISFRLWSNISLEDAKQVVRNFLTTGKVDWSDVRQNLEGTHDNV